MFVCRRLIGLSLFTLVTCLLLSTVKVGESIRTRKTLSTMDLEDIEDLYSKDDEPLQRLQVDQVIARVKRHRVNPPVNAVKLDTNGFDSISEDDPCDSETDGSDASVSTGTHAQPNDDVNRVNKKLYRAQLNVNRKFREAKSGCSSSCVCEPDGGCSNGKKVKPDTLNNALPGRARVYVKTWGCAHNNSDSEYMAGLLKSYGYTIVDDGAAADLWLLNSCTVKQPAEQHLANYVQTAMEQGKRVVVAGCVSQSAPKSKYLNKLSIVGVQQIDRVVEVVEETLKGNTVRLLGVRNSATNVNGDSNKTNSGRSTRRLTRLNMPKIRRNPLIEIVAINVGCLNQCTYCKTKHARGELASYSMREIVERVLVSVREGVREVWLTSEDTGAYGKDLADQDTFEHDRFEQLFSTKVKFTSSTVAEIDRLKPTIANLLRCVLGALPYDCRLRLGMTNPPYILEHLKDIAAIMHTDSRIYKFLHIPVQSGSDEVLSDMKREYTSTDFENIVNYMRTK
jgi:MiaB/RimO family radical SAM methylthiotransferase